MLVEPSYEELKNQNLELENVLYLYKKIIDNLPIPVFAKDAQDDFKCIICNKESEKFIGMKSNQIIGKNISRLFENKEKADSCRNIDISVMNGNEITNIPNEKLVTAEGYKIVHIRKIPIYDENNQPQILLDCLEDITQKVGNEQALIDYEENFRLIFENNAAALTLIDFDTKYSMVNDAFCNITGYSKKEIIGKSWTEQVVPNDLGKLMESHKARLANPVCSPKKHEFSFFKKNGEIGHTIMSVDILPNAKKYIASFTDITEIKEKEIQLQNIIKELNKLNSDKDSLLSILTHDLRSPFNAMLGFLKLLTQNIHNYDINTIENQISIVNKCAQNIFNLLEELLMWTSLQSGNLSFKPEKLNFTKICNEILTETKPIADAKNISIDNLTTKELHVVADVELLKTILRNLVSNAIKFTSPSGQVIIYAEQNHNDITISVADNGIGMAHGRVKKLFDISQKLSTKGTANETGTGLGLILCKEFIEKHNGKIWVESELGKGSKFKFTLPKA